MLATACTANEDYYLSSIYFILYESTKYIEYNIYVPHYKSIYQYTSNEIVFYIMYFSVTFYNNYIYAHSNIYTTKLIYIYVYIIQHARSTDHPHQHASTKSAQLYYYFITIYSIKDFIDFIFKSQHFMQQSRPTNPRADFNRFI